MCITNKKLLIGDWDEGYALDQYNLKSTFEGYDQFGESKFSKTVRTEIGEIINSIKYWGDLSAIPNLINASVDFINSEWGEKKIDVVIPVPPSKHRAKQPVFLIAEGIASKLGIGYYYELFTKSQTETKGLPTEKKKKILRDDIVKTKTAQLPINILIVDDVYSSGATIDILVEKLREDKNINEIRVLTMTKTKNGN